MLDEDGVTGEIAVDDGRLTGVQEAGDVHSPECAARAQPEGGWPVAASLPESRQDLGAPALPGLEQRPELSIRRGTHQSPAADKVSPTYHQKLGKSALH